MIMNALQYYYRKASNEVKQFLGKIAYDIDKMSVEKDGILYYTCRILPSQDISGDPSLCDASFDLCCTTFCVPISDYQSPVARAVIDEVHWCHPNVKHCGVESVMGQTCTLSTWWEAFG